MVYVPIEVDVTIDKEDNEKKVDGVKNGDIEKINGDANKVDVWVVPILLKGFLKYHN